MRKIKLVAIVAILSTGFIVTAQEKIDLGSSGIKWIGKKIGGEHYGSIQLKDGTLEIKDNKIVSGNFTVDMASITNKDIENENFNKKLVDHLKSDDFFGVERYPESTFIITKSTEFSDGKANVTGKLTIKGKTEEIKFDVIKKGNEYTATINVDRSKFDVRYGSKSFFDDLGDKAIDDIFVLDIKVVI